MSSRWWRRNAVALVALAVLVPATAVAIGWREWTAAYEGGLQRSRPIMAGDDGTVQLDGAVFGPVKSGIFTEDDDLPVPDGAIVVAVKIPVDNTDAAEPVGCSAPVLVEQSTGRQWSEMSLDLGLPYDPDAPAFCDTTQEGSYEMLVPFIVPEDAEGSFWVDVAPYDSAPSFARFSISP